MDEGLCCTHGVGGTTPVSTILDALRRVERDRRPAADARSLREAVASGHEAGAAAASRAWRVPLISLLLGLGLGAGALLVWGGETGGEPDPRAGESAAVNSVARVEPAAVNSVARVEPAAEATARSEAPAEVAGKVAIPAVPAKPPAAQKQQPSNVARDRRLHERLRAHPYRPGHATRQAAQVPLPRGRGIGPGGTAFPYPFEAAPPRAAPKSPAPVRREPPAPVAPEPQVAVVSLEPAPLPPAPAVAKESLLAVQVERTFWHPRAERREAILRLPDQEESVRVREGEALGRFTVMLIEPSRVVFEKDGVEIVGRLKAK
jgi:hypothetical protein